MTIRIRGDAAQALVRLKKNGVLIHNEARTFTGPNAEALARSWRDRLLAKLKKEGVPATQLARTTLRDLLGDYRTALEEVKAMRRAMLHELDQLEAELGDMKLNALNSQVFTEFARRRRLAGAGPATVLHNLSTLRSVLNAAKPMFGLGIDGTAVSEAITALTRTGHVSKSAHRDRRPTTRELDLLIAEFIRIAPNPSTIIPMASIVQLAVELPRRLGELVQMRWENYNTPQRPNVLLLEDTKHPSEPRNEVIPVPPAARVLLDALPRIDERILPYKPESISASFERACKRLGIEDLRFHDLRHEGISQLIESGKYTIPEVAMISGHLSWNTLKRYTHLRPETVLEKMDRAGQ